MRKRTSMKSIKEYLPKNEEQTAISAKLPKPLYNQVKQIMKRDDLTLVAVLTACLTHFVDEMNQKKSA
jgi:hypothetical protein